MTGRLSLSNSVTMHCTSVGNNVTMQSTSLGNSVTMQCTFFPEHRALLQPPLGRGQRTLFPLYRRGAEARGTLRSLPATAGSPRSGPPSASENPASQHTVAPRFMSTL